METRKDRLTGNPVSLLGFGAMRLPVTAQPEARIDWEAAEKMIDYAYESGVNYFDTAYPYHKGESELFIGHALEKYPRDSFYLADKMPPWDITCREDVPRIFEDQLAKCRVDYFDFYLSHNLSGEMIDVVKKNDVISYLDSEKKKGRIRRLGFSFHDTPEVLEENLKLYDWDFVQIQLNYLDWDLQDAKRKYEILNSRHLPVIVMEPVRGGTLATLSGESERILKDADPNVSQASWAIRFAASLPGVQTVLSGMSDMAQVKDNVGTMTGFRGLTQEEQNMLLHVADVYRKSVTVPCTGCRYCMDCPNGVDIPAVFRIYNNYALNKDLNEFKRQLDILGETKQAAHCVKCGLCAPHCPQGISIPERLTQIQQLLA